MHAPQLGVKRDPDDRDRSKPPPSGTTIDPAPGTSEPLQVLIETNMDVLFGVRFIASEHSTGKKHGGRIDSLGLDENGSPVTPRLVCVASDFTRYDEHAIAQINRSVELVRYRDYDGAFLTLDLMASTSATATSAEGQETPGRISSSERTVAQLHERAPQELRDLYDVLDAYLVSLGDDVTKTVRKNYYAFRRIRNFACVEIHPQTRKLLVYLKADPGSITLEPGFTRDVSKIGHFGTGNLEVAIGNRQEL